MPRLGNIYSAPWHTFRLHVTNKQMTAVDGKATVTRIFAPHDAAFAQKGLAAAELAWRFLVERDSILKYPEEENSGSGAYSDGDDADDRFWAAIELWLATRRDAYHEYVVWTAR